jgi:hypothetical protein
MLNQNAIKVAKQSAVLCARGMSVGLRRVAAYPGYATMPRFKRPRTIKKFYAVALGKVFAVRIQLLFSVKLLAL